MFIIFILTLKQNNHDLHASLAYMLGPCLKRRKRKEEEGGRGRGRYGGVDGSVV